MPRKPTAKRALPEDFKQRSTKSGGGKVIKGKSPKKTTKKSGVKIPKTGSIDAILRIKRTKKK